MKALLSIVLFVVILSVCVSFAQKPASPATAPRDYVYSVNEVWSLAGQFGAKWNGRRYLPFLLGDDPKDFKALPDGAHLTVLGEIGAIPSGGQFSVIGHYADVPKVWFFLITSEASPGVAMECRIDFNQLVYFRSHQKGAVAALVHGDFKRSKNLPVLQKCSIDGILDLHGDIVALDPKAIPPAGTQQEIELRTWPQLKQ